MSQRDALRLRKTPLRHRRLPLEQVAQKVCISEILDKLQKFTFEPKSTACITCTRACRSHGELGMVRYEDHITKIVTRMRSYFDGLCLDCLDRTQPKLADTDKDYWTYASLREEEWCMGCRVQHKEATW